ncbi:intercompartmental signaling factor BofC [Neobacillus niacini]|uniref:intercompartmental signaling factor BofC n=1 Tax=Neobacillus niacini TaxID=86668 RepID=UPI00052F876C|nr:intercompartmental signaling factor BofC [Neobacillus niacini]KGM45526.1 regulator [Neobacillus niacini]MEC1521818.1 intercompartmental signaling factor BofC [Neobacillus niacini]
MRFNWVAQYRLGLAFVTVVLFMSFGMVPGVLVTGFAEQMENHQDQQNSEPQQLTIILERIYLDGEISEEVVFDSYWSIENFWAKYDQWQLVDIDESTMVFRKQVDDISPLLKTNGYFGITDDGVLTIYNGRPDPSRIIQSFFQIDVKKLESKKQEELIQGIPIKTRDRYVEVLETFKPYSLQE